MPISTAPKTAITLGSPNSPVAGSPVRLNATALACFSATARARRLHGLKRREVALFGADEQHDDVIGVAA